MRVLACVALFLAFGSASASEQQTPREKAMAYCKVMSEFAHLAMEHRQAGTQMSKIIEVAENDNLLQGVLVEAYSRPRYDTKESQGREVVDFENEVYALCVKGVSKE